MSTGNNIDDKLNNSTNYISSGNNYDNPFYYWTIGKVGVVIWNNCKEQMMMIIIIIILRRIIVIILTIIIIKWQTLWWDNQHHTCNY